MDFNTEPLTPFEVRVLGVLAEKAVLTPDVYPLSLNGIVTGANQLSNREPVMSITDSTAEAAIKVLQARRLARTYFPVGSRVAKYEHLLREVFALDDAQLAALIVLLLRGPQTGGEIRNRSGRLYPFASVESVERSLEALAAMDPPLAVQLPRAPGTKEPRWAHLLCGRSAVEHESIASHIGASGDDLHAAPGPSRIEQLEQTVQDLQRQLETLRAEFEALKSQLGS